VIRPGKANQEACLYPLANSFFQNFEERITRECDINNNSIKCCMYSTICGHCDASDWKFVNEYKTTWDGMESVSIRDELGANRRVNLASLLRKIPM